MDTTAASEFRHEVGLLFGGEDRRLFNGTIAEASAVIEQAFVHGKKQIRILSNRLSPECYGTDPVVEAALGFLTSNPVAVIQILVEELDEHSASLNPFLSRIHQAAPSRVKVRRVPPDVSSQYTYNFITVDDLGYRFEEDRRAPLAVAVGGPEARVRTQSLAAIFDQIWGMCSPSRAAIAERRRAVA